MQDIEPYLQISGHGFSASVGSVPDEPPKCPSQALFA
jgi:hypothetical protein